MHWLIKRPGRLVLDIAEKILGLAFGSRLNPLYALGSLSFFMFWIVAASGLYLYIFFDTSINGAYQSIENLTVSQWYLGGVMRSLHRYASDAMVVLVFLHMLREYVYDRYRGARWYSWSTGFPLVWLMYAAGIGGYWLVWDEMAQYIATTTAEWFDWLPLYSEPMARNFMSQASIDDRFFSLLVFLHIGVPLFMLLGMWVHIERIANPASNPPRELAWGSLLALIVLSLVKPAVSQPPANLDVSVTTLPIDWFYLYFYPLIEHWSPGTVWIVLLGASLLLAILPWLPRKKDPPAARVDLPNCNGCRLCFDDCPYDAVTMVPRTDGLPYTEQAAVDPDLCVACGICAGACPTSTPYRRKTALVPGIDMPSLPISSLRDQVLQASAMLEGKSRVIVFSCQHGKRVADTGVDTAVIELPCISALPPSFIDFVLSRGHADGVYLAGCKDGACYHRFGIDWMSERLDRRRDPRLRQRIPRRRIGCNWRRIPDLHFASVDIFRENLAELEGHIRNVELSVHRGMPENEGEAS